MEKAEYSFHEAGNYKTIPEYLKYITKKSGDKVAFKFMQNKQDIEKTYKKFSTEINYLAEGILENGFKDKKIGILGENSYDWILTYFGIVCAGNIVVPIDKDLQIDEVKNIISEANVELLFLSKSYDDYEELLKKDFPDLKIIMLSELNNVMEKGKKSKKKLPVPKEDDVSTIIFTSGTTSKPKGVMLTQRGLCSDTIGCEKHLQLTGDLVLVLPLHHTFAFTANILFALTSGYAICIPSSLKKIDETLKKYKPSSIMIVPMLVEAFYNKIWKSVREKKKEKLIKFMIGLSNFLLKLNIDIRKKVFKQIIDAFGGNLNLIISGGASLEPSFVKGFRDFGIDVFNGYGITECSPVVSVNRNRYYRDGSVGKPLNGVTVKIKKENEEEREGEILVKGDLVMKGYYNRPDLTSEAIDEEGFFDTGDIGYLDEEGFLFITGRKKNIIILDNGKNIYPEELEGRLQIRDEVQEVLVYENDKKITAEVFPNFEVVPNDEHAKDIIQGVVDEVNKNLPFYKKIESVVIRDTEFEKTTTKKIKRRYK